MFSGKPDNLEIFRYFRMNYFNSINEFYDSFYKSSDLDLADFFKKNDNEIKYRKYKGPFYSLEDIKFNFPFNFLVVFILFYLKNN